MSQLEKVAKQRIPVVFFVPLRILLGLTWILYFVKYAVSLPNPALLSWSVIALIAGILLVLGLFTGLGAFLSTLLVYFGWLVFFGIGELGRPTTALTLLLASIALLSWKTGRVLGLDKYIVEKVPVLAKYKIV